MNKLKYIAIASAVGAVAIVSALAVQAATPLTVSCTGTVSGNQVTWAAASTGGNAPVAFLWSGDSQVAGSTSTSLVGTYTTNGTFTAMIQGTDASSTVATSTCSATVTSNVVVTPTSTLSVFVNVNNTAGGSATPASFTATVSGASATPSSFTGNASGTSVVVNANTVYAVSASTLANYTSSMSGNCIGPIAAGATASCTVTETFVSSTPNPTSTPPAPHVMPSSLSINPNGEILARGMTVTSVASGSFQAMVWGITYTVNYSNQNAFNFVLRGGEDAGMNVHITNQVSVGDEVSVQGRIDPSNPLVINAKVVRDWSITKPRPENPGKGEGHGLGNFDVNANINVTSGSASSANIQFNGRLQDLMNQLHNLQNLFKSKGGGDNGKGGGNGGNGDH